MKSDLKNKLSKTNLIVQIITAMNGCTYLDRQSGTWEDLQVVHVLLDILGTLDGRSDSVVSLFLFLLFGCLLVDWRPHNDHGITDKFNDVSTTLVQV